MGKLFPGSTWAAAQLSRKGKYGLPAYGEDVTFVLSVDGVPIWTSPTVPLNRAQEYLSVKLHRPREGTYRCIASFRSNDFFTRHRRTYRLPVFVTILPSGWRQFRFYSKDRPFSFYLTQWGRSLSSFFKSKTKSSDLTAFAASMKSSNLPGTKSFNQPFMRIILDECFPPTSVVPQSYLSYYRSWTGVRTPNFGKLNGRRLPINPHTVDLRRIADNLGTKCFFQPKPGTCGIDRWYVEENKSSSLFTGMTPANPVHDASNVNKALSRLAKRADNDLSANNAQNVAQFGQFIRLAGNNIARITNAMRNLKRGNFSKAADALFQGKQPKYRPGGGLSKTKTLAQNWLELQYGWKPLLSDIDGTLKAIAKFNYAGYVVQQVRSSATSSVSTASPVLNVHQRNVGTRYIRTISTTKYGLRYVLDDRLTALLAQTGFLNAPALAWELLPFSFVVDWFLPIGPYLEALQAWKGYKFIDGFRVQFTKQETFSSAYYNYQLSFQPGAEVYSGSGAYSSTLILLNRTKLTTFPMPQFPQLKNPFSVTHVLNGLALMRQLFK